MDPILTMSATALAKAIRSRSLLSIEVVEAHIQHLEAVNPALNAVVVTRFDAARQEAEAADKRVRSAKKSQALPPLLGVPCTIKEAFSLTGMPNTSGLVRRIGKVSTSDATTVARLRGAGAIPLGVTNLSELCMWYESNNRVYGRSNNPYNPDHIVGGSSGGEGAAVGAGFSPFGLGADIGGSIRMPAFFNGVFGHKPTGCMVPNSGQHPIAEGEALRYLCSGPLARRAEDLMPLLRILAGPDGEDPLTREWELGEPDDVRAEDLVVIDVPDGPAYWIHEALQRAQRQAVEALRARGARIVHRRFPAFRRGAEMWSALLDLADGTEFKVLMGEGEAINMWAELARAMVGRSPHTLPAIILALVEKVPRLMPQQQAHMAEQVQALRAELLEALGPNGVMIIPSHPRPAPRHKRPLLHPVSFANTAIFNVLEMPVTQVPLGLSSKGLPLGVQVVAPHGQDHRCIAVAKMLEDDLGGWVPPSFAFL